MSMLTRIARAIDPERAALIDSLDVNNSARSGLIVAEKLRALAVLNAMRDPTPAMINAPEGNTGCAEEVWQYMIDAAASE